MTRHCHVIPFTFLTACQGGPITVFVMTGLGFFFYYYFFLNNFIDF